jgi:hypothetical protein
MRRAVFAILLAAGVVRADPAQYLQGDALQAEVSKSCAGGCIVFAPAEIEAIQAQFNAELQRRTKAAFEAGMKQGNLSCRNAI